jgi:predicted amino acid dehydrogenase
MKHIVSLSLGSSNQNGERLIQCGDRTVRLTRLGADYDLQMFYHWLEKVDGQCDLIALSGLPPPVRVGRRIFRHDLLTSAQSKIKKSLSVDGSLMQGMVLAWAIDQAMSDGRLNIAGHSVAMLSSLMQQDVCRTLASKAQKVFSLDPWTFLGLPLALETQGRLDSWALRLIPGMVRYPLSTNKLRRLSPLLRFAPTMSNAWKSQVIVLPETLLSSVDPEVLEGKIVLLDRLTRAAQIRLENARVHNAYAVKFGWRQSCEDLSGAELEAILMITLGQDDPLSLDTVIQCVVEHRIETDIDVLYPDRREPVRKFAFVVHPLSRTDLFRHPWFRPLQKIPVPVQKLLERGVARLPGLRYGTLRGVVSDETGAEVEGLIYSLFATPKEMLAADTDEIYQRLVHIAEHAEAQGARILGLGAFTKIVGDAGVSVAEQSPIPVTTGNSLSAAATLWAAREICQKLGFVRLNLEEQTKIQGRAMVIGASGSIGKACAKIMAHFFSEVVLSATNGYRLMQIGHEIEAECLGVQIKVTTHPDRYAGGCDLIVIATSATEGGVLNIQAIKPGCVVCDVSRPLTFTAEQAMERPDVLIVESGEIQLPGNVSLDCDIGLSDSVVYACLAETAILALEGRYECFSLSRNISTKKIGEIFKLAEKHGAKMAEIRGPCGLVTDHEITLCREHAAKRLNGPVTAPPRHASGGPEVLLLPVYEEATLRVSPQDRVS